MEILHTIYSEEFATDCVGLAGKPYRRLVVYGDLGSGRSGGRSRHDNLPGFDIGLEIPSLRDILEADI